MITQTYQIEPVDGSDIRQLAKDGENIQLRENLNLPSLDLKEGSSDFFRFRTMTKDEHNIYSVLYPARTNVSKYKEFIPNEVLSALVEFKNSCPYFHINEGVVWHHEQYDPDPVLTVSCRDVKDDYEFPNKTFIVARWGEALEDLEVLKKKAFDIWKSARITRLEEIIEDASTALRKTKSSAIITDTSNPYLSL